MNKEEIQEKFIGIMDNEPHVLIEEWNKRAHDVFYKYLYIIKQLIDSHPEFTGFGIPMKYICAAYCFDGDKKSSLEKTKALINESDTLVDDYGIIKAYIELERIEDLGEQYIEEQ